jgi:hypothetical protein
LFVVTARNAVLAPKVPVLLTVLSSARADQEVTPVVSTVGLVNASLP